MANTSSGASLTLDATCLYEAENYTIEVAVRGNASVVAGAAVRNADPALVEVECSVESPASAGVSMDVAVLNGKAPARQSAEDYAQDGVDEEDIVDVSALEFDFSCNGEPLDVSACDVSATIIPNGKLQAAADAIEAPNDTADDAEVGVIVAALQSDGSAQPEKLGSVMVEKGASERPTMTLSLDSAAPALQLVARSALNLHFTVQYYANLEIADRDPDGYLTIIDTDNGGNCEGGILPSNGTDPDTTGLYLVDAGNGKREIRTKMQLTELYAANEYDYFDAPSLPYVNIFRSNGNYKASEVWVLNEGADPTSIDENDWTVHEGIVAATELHFTNNPDKKDDPDTVYIQDGTVIRLVANQTEGEYDTPRRSTTTTSPRMGAYLGFRRGRKGHQQSQQLPGGTAGRSWLSATPIPEPACTGKSGAGTRPIRTTATETATRAARSGW